ncbi:MAG: putative glycoside hydrolase [Peptococcaceae bacterium]
MKGKITAPIVLILVAALWATIFTAGCEKDLYATNQKTEPEVEQKSAEEIQKEKEALAEQQRLEEEKRRQEERAKKEEALKEELGPFYVPLPPEEQEANPQVKARGIYLTGNSVGLASRFPSLVEMVETTELNAMVIDVKNDNGLMSYPSEIEIVQQVNANRNAPVKNMGEVLQDLEQRNIYTIARIVVFKDPNLPEQRPEWALQKKSGGVWRDKNGVAWVNPYEKKVWDYNIAIAKEAALLGFKEIQFDYIRFPENAKKVDQEVSYGENVVNKDEIIEQFLSYAREQLQDYNVHLAADVFGVIATSWGDSDKIGQTWERMTANLDYICPMIYPSHYGPGYFGFKVPDANPAGTIREALKDAIERNASLKKPAIIRPWLQGFTASWVPGNISYGPAEIKKQIDTALALGIDEYIIWNASNRYMKESFGTVEEYQNKVELLEQERNAQGLDALGRTKTQALEEFLNVLAKKDWRDALVLQANDSTTYDFTNYKNWVDGWTGKLASYEIKTDSLNQKGTDYELNLVVKRGAEEVILSGQKFQVIAENKIWKVRPPAEFLQELIKAPAAAETNNQDEKLN